MIVLGDTCSIEYCFKGGLLERVQNEKFTDFLITLEVFVEIQKRVPDALSILKYSIVQMSREESILSIIIEDAAIKLFGKNDLTSADTSLIAVASTRNIPIYSDNRGVYWFFKDFLKRNYKKEPYKSAREYLKSKIRYIPVIYSSSAIIPEIYSNYTGYDLQKLLSKFTAKSDYWFSELIIRNLGLDYNAYIQDALVE